MNAQETRLLLDDELHAVSGGIRDEVNCKFIQDSEKTPLSALSTSMDGLINPPPGLSTSYQAW